MRTYNISPNITETILPTLDDAFESCKNLTWLTWQQSSKAQQTGKPYHYLFPMSRPKSLNSHLAPKIQCSRAYAYIAASWIYLFKLGLHIDGKCEQCMTPDVVPHFLLSCTKNTELSEKLAAAYSAHNSCSHSPVLQTYLTEVPFVDIIWDYITEKKLKL